jgi:hypothetical protein
MTGVAEMAEEVSEPLLHATSIAFSPAVIEQTLALALKKVR